MLQNYLDYLDKGKKKADFVWLRNQAKDERSKKLVSGIEKLYNEAYKGKYIQDKQLFFIELGNYKIWLRQCSAYSSLDMYTDIFKHNRHFLLPEFSGQDAKIVIDGGACEGFYTLKIKQNNPACKILAIEPNPIVFEILKKNIESNHLKNVILVNKALDIKVGKIPFEYVEQISSTGGKNMKIIKRPWLKKSMIKKTTVECTTLKELCKEYNLEDIDILKLDIQGMEAKVLKQSKDLLPRVHKIVAEWHTLEIRKEIIGFLKKYDFELVFEEKRLLGDLYFMNKSFLS